MRCGAGISSQSTSGRSRASRIWDDRSLELRRGRRRVHTRLVTCGHGLRVSRIRTCRYPDTPPRPARIACVPCRRLDRPAGPRLRLPAGRPRRAGAPHPGVVHASGGPVAAGVPQGPRGRRDARVAACGPTWSSRSPCSRCAATASTPRSSSPTSCCRSRRSASTSTSCPVSARWSPSRCATLADVAAIPDLTPDHVRFVTEAVRALVGELGATPLIGFAGAPFTVASYLVEGGPSKEHAKTKAMMFGAPDVWDALLRKIAGDRRGLPRGPGRGRRLAPSSCSTPGPARCRRPTTRATCMPHSAGCWPRPAALGVPRIHFGVGTGELLGLMGEAGADVVGVDWRVPLADGVRRVGDRAVQGNLDPALVFAPTEVMLAERATEIVEAGRAARGHIFNLGHGVLPATDPDQLARLTDHVHSLQRYCRFPWSPGDLHTPRVTTRAVRSPAPANRRRPPLPQALTSSHAGTPKIASSTVNGSSAPTAVAATTSTEPSACQPARSPATKPASSTRRVAAPGRDERQRDRRHRRLARQVGLLRLQRLQLRLSRVISSSIADQVAHVFGRPLALLERSQAVLQRLHALGGVDDLGGDVLSDRSTTSLSPAGSAPCERCRTPARDPQHQRRPLVRPRRSLVVSLVGRRSHQWTRPGRRPRLSTSRACLLVIER